MGMKNPPPGKGLADLKAKQLSAQTEVRQRTGDAAAWHREQMLQLREKLAEVVRFMQNPVTDKDFVGIMAYIFETYVSDPPVLFDLCPIDYNTALAWSGGRELNKAQPATRREILDMLVCGVQALPLTSTEEAISTEAEGLDKWLDREHDAPVSLKSSLPTGITLETPLTNLLGWEDLPVRVRDALESTKLATVGELLLYRCWLQRGVLGWRSSLLRQRNYSKGSHQALLAWLESHGIPVPTSR